MGRVYMSGYGMAVRGGEGRGLPEVGSGVRERG